MSKRVNKFLIMSNSNTGERRTVAQFFKRSEAKKALKRYNSNARHSMSGIGYNNSRIKKIKGYI